MKKLNLIAVAMLAGLISMPAWAASQRTFVSALRGEDTGGCSAANPCQTFNYAIGQTSSGGEVIALDSGNYAPVTITKSVTIETAPGVYAGITAASPGVSVTGGASVTLRGLAISGAGDGIDFTGGAALSVEDCVIDGGTLGINHTSTGNLFVKDTIIGDCSGSGVYLDASAAGAHESLNHVWLVNSATGLDAINGLATISDSVISNNTGIGIYVNDTLNQSEVDVENCRISNNATGFEVNGGTGRVSNSTVTDNSGIGLYQSVGKLYTRVNNTVAGNGTDTSPSILSIFLVR